MEDKVVTSVIAQAQQQGGWLFDKEQAYCNHRGSGNNWADGYANHDEDTRKIFNIIRKAISDDEYCDGFLVIVSVAGGTGSGLGTRITQILRHEYPQRFILNLVVWPYLSGEVIVQNYNAVLSLARIYDASDGVIVVSNDAVQDICAKMMHLSTVSFDAMNQVIATQLAALFKSTDFKGSSPLCGIVQHLCSHPCFKLLTMRCTPLMPDTYTVFTTYNWKSMLRNLQQLLIANGHSEEGLDWTIKPSRVATSLSASKAINKSIATLIVLRGQLQDADIDGYFQDPGMYSSLSGTTPFTVWRSPTPLLRHQKAVALLSNCQSPIQALDSVTSKAWEMYSTKAFTHQYAAHGITDDDFMQSFVRMEQIVKDYREI